VFIHLENDNLGNGAVAPPSRLATTLGIRILLLVSFFSVFILVSRIIKWLIMFVKLLTLDKGEFGTVRAQNYE